MTKPIIEFVTFRLSDGVSRENFAAAAKAMGAWVSAQPGVVRRRLSCIEDGTWLEHIEWASMADAKAAAAAIGKEPGNADFVKAIDGPTVSMSHSMLEVALA